MQHIPPAWEAILNRRLRSYAALSGERRERFLSYVGQFLRATEFVGEAGMEIDDDVRVTIAGTGVRLVLDLGIDRLCSVRQVIVYPHSVPLHGILSAGAAESDGSNLVLHLGWAQVLHGLADPRDGYDIVIHEFAHVLDHEAGRFDGIPQLRPSQDYELWSHILYRHFLDHWFKDPAQASMLRPYARTSPAEFFAVATEAFFERPQELAAILPDLYFKLKHFYGRDPDEA